MDQALLVELAQGGKAAQIKRQIIAHFIEKGPATITELAKVLSLSVPTVTKFVSDLIQSKCIKDYGKLETNGGRYPLLYGLDPEAGYFVGVDVKHSYINIGIIDFVGDMQQTFYDIPYDLESTPEKMKQLCEIILDVINQSGHALRDILNVNINLPGRINPETGYSYTYFNFSQDRPLAKMLGEELGLNVSIDNDTRGMAYGEYTQGCAMDRKVENVLYVNVSWGIGLGIILGGQIYLGKSGFSGEFGHISNYDNQILCHCGKKGCLETEVSGQAMHRMLHERIRAGQSSILSERVLSGEPITMSDIIQAAVQEDILCLEILSDIGKKLGKQIASLINVFNPELVIIGGSLSLTGDYLTQAIQTVVRMYSLNLVNKDTEIVTASLGEHAGVIGACMLARTRRFS